MSFAPVASAKYSRLREIARATRRTAMGARIERTTPIIRNITWALPPLSSLFENHRLLRNSSAIIEINPMRTAVSVIKRMSKFAMCDISWAMTPSNSCLLSFSSEPVVMQITACFGSRPEANAFISGESITYKRGIGNPEAIDMLSAAWKNILWCVCKAGFALTDASAILSEL